MTGPEILALVAFLFPLAFSPGPGNLFFAANGARFGMSATLPANLGYHAATFVATLAIGSGFAGAGAAMPGLFMAVKWTGSAYMLWLAWGFLRAARTPDAPIARVAGARDGAVLLFLNPKAYVIMALMFSQFLPQSTARPGTILAITSVFTLNNCAAFLVYTLLGDRLAARFRQNGQGRGVNAAFAAIMIAVAIWMLLA